MSIPKACLIFYIAFYLIKTVHIVQFSVPFFSLLLCVQMLKFKLFDVLFSI